MPDSIRTALEVRLPEGRPRTLSSPSAFVRVQQRPDGTLTFTAPRPDPFAKLAKAFGQMKMALGLSLLDGVRRAAVEMDRQLAQVRATLRAGARVGGWLVDQANALPRIAGLEARYYVRAALDPAYPTPWHLSGLVQSVLRGDDPDLELVTRANRIAIAVSAMRGWEERGTTWTVRGRSEPPLIAHRQWGSTAVEVRCG